jgi:hypothetical protein
MAELVMYAQTVEHLFSIHTNTHCSGLESKHLMMDLKADYPRAEDLAPAILV